MQGKAGKIQRMRRTVSRLIANQLSVGNGATGFDSRILCQKLGWMAERLKASDCKSESPMRDSQVQILVHPPKSSR